MAPPVRGWLRFNPHTGPFKFKSSTLTGGVRKSKAPPALGTGVSVSLQRHWQLTTSANNTSSRSSGTNVEAMTRDRASVHVNRVAVFAAHRSQPHGRAAWEHPDTVNLTTVRSR